MAELAGRLSGSEERRLVTSKCNKCRKCQDLTEIFFPIVISRSSITRAEEKEPYFYMDMTEEGLPHYRYVRDLLKSMVQGCEMCRLFESTIPWKFDSHTSAAYHIGFGDRCILLTGLQEHLYSERARWVGRAIDVCREGLGVPTAVPTVSGIWRSKVCTDNEGRFALIRAWMRECRRNHPKCRQIGKRQIPTRLLDLRSIDGSKDLHLMVPKDRKWCAYAALSHCWGGKLSCRLTSATQEQMLRCIKYQSLPQTFQDAIVVCRGIGLRYLWIDALCIVQEEDETLHEHGTHRTTSDWESEASNMANVYHHAALNISALMGESSKDGLFASQRAPIVVALGSMEPSEPESVFLQKRPMTFSELSVNSYVPLDTRAWVLQERLLSNATLHFGPDQLYWECRSLCTCEDGEDVPSNILLKGMKQPYHLPIDHPYSLWRFLLEDYTKRNLTYESDRLVALAGLISFFMTKSTTIEKFHINTLDLCAFGIWRGDPIGLLWAPDIEADFSLSPRSISIMQKSDIPSWSWASINCRVTYRDIFTEPEDAIPQVEVEFCQLDSVPTFLQLKGGRRQVASSMAGVPRERYPFLRIRGALHSMKGRIFDLREDLDLRVQCFNGVFQPGQSGTIYIYTDCRQPLEPREEARSLSLKDCFLLKVATTESVDVGTTTFCLVLTEKARMLAPSLIVGQDIGRPNGEERAQELPPTQPVLYERVGVARLNRCPWEQPLDVESGVKEEIYIN